jgi:hypothetical protein
VPDTAQALIDRAAMALPHVKITELLLETIGRLQPPLLRI